MPPGYYPLPATRRRRRSSRLVALLLTVAVLVGLISGATNFGGSAISPDTATPQLGSFAGYIGYVSVDQISASWHVPAISVSSPDGSASTWIGVQGPGEREFFQIGTTETSAGGVTLYEAFWSDPARGFHAQVLMQVNAGDEIDAQIAQVSGRWWAFIDDVTTGQRQSAPTASGVFTNLQLAEWIQEDPSLPHGKHVPYPDIAPTTMAKLRANGFPPSSAALQPQIMVLSHGRRVEPGPIRGDQFTTHRAPAG